MFHTLVKDNPYRGLYLCSRYSYPPNSLSFCGPEDKRSDLAYYSQSGKVSSGTEEILSQFTTLYPYLRLIAAGNGIADPFDFRVVEAYWLGNSLLNNISQKELVNHLEDTLSLRKKIGSRSLNKITDSFSKNTLPHHSFHVLRIFRRTGHDSSNHTIETMDACLINWGKVLNISRNKIKIISQRLAVTSSKLTFERGIIREIKPQGQKDILWQKLRPGDYISYHWGYLCQRLSKRQLANLKYYTLLSITSANSNLFL